MRRRVPNSLTGVLILIIWCVALASTSDGPASEEEKARQPDTEAGKVSARAPSRNAAFYYPFACELFRKVGASGGNLLLSPHSISISLAMARAGAAGETARQMDTLLQLPADSPQVYRELAEALAYTSPAPIAPQEKNDSRGETSGFPIEHVMLLEDHAEYSLKIANGIFGQQGYGIADEFRRSVVENFAVEFLEVDFARSAEARSAINRWVAGRTEKRITEVVPDGLLTLETRVVLADAICFKASWDEAFEESQTVDGSFRVAKGRSVKVKRMRQTERMNYGETREAQLLEIPYRRGNTAMIIVLPRTTDGLDTLVKNMTAEKIQRWTSAMQEKRVALELPRFDFSSNLDLSHNLAAMGMTDAFSSEKANFSGMTAQKPFYLDALLHTGHVAVDEKGTAAAAVTLAFVTLGVDSEKPVPFVVDHPFLFLIRHMETGAILFMGRVVDPTAR